MMIVLEDKDAEVQTRLRSSISELRDIETAEAIDEELLSRRCNTPAAFTMLTRTEARDKTPGRPEQLQRIELRIGIVTDGVAQTSRAMKGSRGSYKIRELALGCIHHWKLSGALGSFRFIGEEFVGRAGGRLLWEQIYACNVHETFS